MNKVTEYFEVKQTERSEYTHEAFKIIYKCIVTFFFNLHWIASSLSTQLALPPTSFCLYMTKHKTSGSFSLRLWLTTK